MNVSPFWLLNFLPLVLHFPIFLALWLSACILIVYYRLYYHMYCICLPDHVDVQRVFIVAFLFSYPFNVLRHASLVNQFLVEFFQEILVDLICGRLVGLHS